MKDTVTVDGVPLTREQVERALAKLNKPEPITPIALNVPPDFCVWMKLTDGTRLQMVRRSFGAWGGKGFYLYPAPVGHEWALVENHGEVCARTATLVIRPIAE